MKDEISAAVMFLTRLIAKSERLGQQQIETFRNCLNALLTEKFQNHWFPEKPFKGQAYRCIRVNEMERRDPILEKAAQSCGLKYEDLNLPVELTVWVDPNEVCCRFGEHKGSYCTVASFKNGNKENIIDQINIDEIEHKAIFKTKQTSPVGSSKKKILKKNEFNPLKNGYNRNIGSQQHILQQIPSLPSPSSYSRSSTPTTHVYPFDPMSHRPQVSQPSLFHSRTNGQFGNVSYCRYPQKYFRNLNSYASTTIAASGHFHHNLHSFYSGSNKNDRYHWVNRSVVKA